MLDKLSVTCSTASSLIIGTLNQSEGLPKTAGSKRVKFSETEKLKNLVEELLKRSLLPGCPSTLPGNLHQ